MCMIDGGDRAEVWVESTQKARKEHRCGECGRTISPGEVYHKVFGVQDGDPFSGKWCSHCNVAKDWLWENCGGSILGMIEEDIREHVEEYSRMDIARLAVGMGRDWQRFHGGLMPLPKLPRPLKLGDSRG